MVVRSKQTLIEVVALHSFAGKPNEGIHGRIRRAQRFTTTIARAEELEKLGHVRRVKVVDPPATKEEPKSKKPAKKSTSKKTAPGKKKKG
jgi:hypothetical protein